MFDHEAAQFDASTPDRLSANDAQSAGSGRPSVEPPDPVGQPESSASANAPGGGLAVEVDELLPLLYDELHELARRSLRRERRDHTLQATAVVNELYLKLAGQRNLTWRDRGHFLAVATRAIRRILIDHARARRCDKRIGNRKAKPLDEVMLVSPVQGLDLIALDEAMRRLSMREPRKAQVVELRFFGGLSVSEIAIALGIGERTVERYWQYARAWLFRDLSADDSRLEGEKPRVA